MERDWISVGVEREREERERRRGRDRFRVLKVFERVRFVGWGR